jgi:hypothetical protein
MHEDILSAVMMFLPREGSRNSYNLDREEFRFSRNIRRLLGIRLMHGDASNDVLVRVDTEDLQRLKAVPVRVPAADSRQAEELAKTGRLCWKIENEGFNTQKNLGYNLEHRYSRTDFNAVKNYYQCMQLAHLIEQLALLENKEASGR